MHLSPRQIAAYVLALAALAPRPARATDKAACLDQHEQAQVLRQSGKLRAARAQLELCADSSCPPLIASDCNTWLVQANSEQPTVVIAARDGEKDTTDVEVQVDREVLVHKLDGRPLEVDPGEHDLRFRLSDGREVDSHVLIHEGERDRILHVDFRPTASVEQPPPPPPKHVHGRIPIASWVLGGVGVIGAGFWGYFGISGLVLQDHLNSTCKGTCSPSDISDLKRDYLIADVSMGITVASLGVAVLVAILAPAPAPPPVAVAVIPGGASVTWSARF